MILVACHSVRNTADKDPENGSQNNRIVALGNPRGSSVGNADKVIFRGSNNEVILEYLNAFFHDRDSKDVIIVEGDGNTYRLSHRNVIDNSIGSCDTIILRGNGNHIDLLSSYFMDNTNGHDTTAVLAQDSSYQIIDVSGTVAVTLLDSTENKQTHRWLPIEQVLSQYEKGAVSGDPMASYYLGELYQLGVGVPVSPKKALYYYTISAKAGQRDSRSALGYLYEGEFDGVPHDIGLAKYWYKLAADQGDPFATQRLVELGQ